MQHTISSIEVFFTNDYGRFKTINGNRELNEGKIKRIISDIGSGIDVLRYYPITVREVKERLEIIDGQHRFYISKKLKRPVYYILLKEDHGLNHIARINSNVEKWKSKDFINCYVQQGNAHYITLQAFMDNYELPVSTSIKLLANGNPGTEKSYGNTVMSEFQRGLFKVQAESEAIRMVELVQSFKGFESWHDRDFMVAIYKIDKAGKVTIPDLVTAYNKNPDRLKREAGYKEYIASLELIFNNGKHSRFVIY